MTEASESTVLVRAVAYLQDSNERVDNQVTAITNAAQSGEFTIGDVLSAYADEVSGNGIIHPRHVFQLKQWRIAAENETDKELPSLEAITAPHTLIQSKSDVLDAAIDVYTSDSIAATQQRTALKELIRDARRGGISVSTNELVAALKEYQPEVSGEGTPVTGVTDGVENVSLATGIDTHGTIKAREDYVYKVKTTNEVNIDTIDWYVGGTHTGTGETLYHSFEFPGIYTIAVELTDEHGRKDHVNTEVSVGDATEVTATISGNTVLSIGETGEFSVDYEAKNTEVESIQWELDEIPVSESETVSNTFNEEGEHNLSVTVVSESNDKATAAETLTVRKPSEITIDLSTPETAYIGDHVTISGEIEAKRSDIEDVSCEINGDPVAIASETPIKVEHVFDEPGTHNIKLSATNDIGDADTETDSVSVSVDPQVSIVDAPDEIQLGDEVTVEAEYDQRLHREWGVTNASLDRVDGTGARIRFNTGISDTATVRIQVRNDDGETATDETFIDVLKPNVATVIERPDKVVAGHPANFTVDASKIEHDKIDSVEWKLRDGTVIGSGETLIYEFSAPGPYRISATVYTESGEKDTSTISLEAQPDTSATAVIVASGGDTTRDDFVLDGSKSVTKNTEITSYTWTIAGRDELHGESVEVNFETPGDYEIVLDIETDNGDTDRTVEHITVSKYTGVSAVIEGPETVERGDRTDFTASDSIVENTTIASYEWLLNDKPAGTGDSFSQTFSQPGHYTVSVVVTTTSGDTGRASHSVTVNTPGGGVTPKVDIVGSPVVNEPVVLSAAKTGGEYTTITDYKWVSEGRVIGSGETLETTFSEYGPVKLGLVVTTENGKRESKEIEFLIEPTRKHLPYPLVTERTSPSEVLEAAESLYKDDALTPELKNKYASHLIHDADAAGVDTSVEAVTNHIESVDGINSDAVEIDLNAFEPVDHDIGEWDTGGQTDHKEEQTDGEPKVTLGDPTESLTDDEKEGDRTENEGKEYETVDPDEIDENHKEDRIAPETFEFGESVLSMPNYAQDLMDFEYIMEKNDDLLPEGVNGAGIVVAENGLYIGIAKVVGRDWSIHTLQKKNDIVKNFETNVLSSLDNHIQIVSVPTQFDLRNHINMVGNVLEENKDNENELLMNIGRSIYPNWVEDFMSRNDMKEREFYIVVPLSVEQLHKFKSGSESLTEQLSEVPGIGGFFDRFQDDAEEDITTYQCLRELNTRMDRLSGNLRRVGVDMHRVGNRNESMGVLYHYFHNHEPEADVFPMGPFTSVDQEAKIGGVSIDHLLTEPETPASEPRTDGGESQ